MRFSIPITNHIWCFVNALPLFLRGSEVSTGRPPPICADLEEDFGHDQDRSLRSLEVRNGPQNQKKVYS